MEPPGTAPGSDPLITSAFMSIVPKDIPYIGERTFGCKPGIAKNGGRENKCLGGPVEVRQDQPQRQDQFDSTECHRFGQGRIVQNDRDEPTQRCPCVDDP